MDAPWRLERKTHWDLLASWVDQGIAPSPIMSAPFFVADVFQLDWLHVMDIGVTCDFIGNCFYLLVRKYPAATERERVRDCFAIVWAASYVQPHGEEASETIVFQELYRRICAYYVANRVDSRIETLTMTMIQKSSSTPPKLRARGAEARGLVGFVRSETAAVFRDDVEPEATAKRAASHLATMYANLSQATFSHDVMAEHSRKFALLLRGLESFDEGSPLWRTKPKLHQMQELCECSVHNPSQNWLYRDEDFGGSMAGLVRIRGGKATPKRVGQNALTKFFARHPLPSL